MLHGWGHSTEDCKVLQAEAKRLKSNNDSDEKDDNSFSKSHNKTWSRKAQEAKKKTSSDLAAFIKKEVGKAMKTASKKRESDDDDESDDDVVDILLRERRRVEPQIPHVASDPRRVLQGDDSPALATDLRDLQRRAMLSEEARDRTPDAVTSAGDERDLVREQSSVIVDRGVFGLSMIGRKLIESTAGAPLAVRIASISASVTPPMFAIVRQRSTPETRP